MKSKMKERVLMSILMLSLFSLLGLLAGCGTQVSTTKEGKSDFFPHSDGYSWNYLSGGTIEYDATVEGFSTEETYSFNGTTELSGGIVVQNYITPSTSEPSYYLINDTGTYYFGTASHPTTEGELDLSFPFYIGKKWQGLGGITAEVVSYETVTTPMGDFQAYKVSFSFPGDFVASDWYASSVGRVKRYANIIIPALVSLEGEMRVVAVTFEETASLESKNF